MLVIAGIGALNEISRMSTSTRSDSPTERAELTQCMGCTCFNLRKATRAVTQLYDEMLRPIGIRVTQFSLLVAVSMAGPVTVTHLAELAVMDRTTLTRNLEVLEKQGLIDVSVGEDRRTRLVTLTTAGQQKLSMALPLWKKAQSRIVKALGGSRWHTIQSHLSEMVRIAEPK